MDGLNFHTIHLSWWGFTKIKTRGAVYCSFTSQSHYLILSERLYRGTSVVGRKGFMLLKSIWEEVFKGANSRISAAWESKQTQPKTSSTCETLAEFQPTCIPSHNRNQLYERYTHFAFTIQHEVTICIDTCRRKVAGAAH